MWKHLERQAGLLGALRDPDRRLVEDQVLTGGDVAEQVTVAHVALDELHAAGGERVREVLAASAHQVVQDDHPRRSRVEQLVDDRGADGAGSAGDEG